LEYASSFFEQDRGSGVTADTRFGMAERRAELVRAIPKRKNKDEVNG